MARCPMVRPETVRVTLADGEWLELAKELTAGEYRDMFIAQFKDAPAGDVPSLDLRQLGVNRILAYVKEWSFVDFKDQPLPITEDWLRKFDQDTFNEVLALVDTHNAAVEQALESRKKTLNGVTKS